jgi:plastocyanin
MPRRTLLALGASAALILAACSGDGGGTAATPAQESGAPAPAASEPAAAGGVCTPGEEAGTVQVTIEGFAFGPANIEASVGDVIAFTNKDAASHTATLDDGACDTGGIPSDATKSLTFNEAGSFPFHCTIHPDMKGTITVS